jgi:hypothetical protein
VQSYKSRVLFKAACGAIPEDAVLLEVGHPMPAPSVNPATGIL